MAQQLAELAWSSGSITTILVAVIIGAASLFLFLYRKKALHASSIDEGYKAASLDQIDQSAEPQPTQEVTKQRVRLLYGTQTGTAERFSKKLAAELRQAYNDSVLVEVTDFENYIPETSLKDEHLVLFLMATYGDGEPTDNAADFYNWIVEEGEAVTNGDREPYLERVSYGVFALGNRQYEHFCAVGKKVDKIMQQLGASRVVRRGDGDDDDCIDDDFDSWKKDLLSELQSLPKLLGLRVEATPVTPRISSYHLEVVSNSVSPIAPFPMHGTGIDHHSPFHATVTRSLELHSPGSDRSCLHAEIYVLGSSIKYEAGDHLAVFPENSPAIVAEAARLLGQPLDLVFKLSIPVPNTHDLSDPFPGPLSLRAALASFADLLSSPHKEALLALAAHASDLEEKVRLEHLASAGGKQEYTEWITQAQRSLLEVMAAFPSAKPPLGVFFACVAPRLQPRYYSISSSPMEHPNSVHVTCAVVKEMLVSGRVHEGVCSTWMQRLPVGSKVPVFWRHSQFKLPPDWSTPLIMVGPGTGLAPFRGFMQERRAAAEQGAKLGEAHLFFGCRNRQHDYIYQQELQDFLTAGAISHLHVAFSREHTYKDYVQHHMERHAEEVWQVLSNGGYLYVCGDAKYMAKDVHRTLISLVAKCQGQGLPQAEKFVQEMTDAGRYHRDVW